MVLMETPVCEFGKKAIDFQLRGVDGKTWNLENCRGKHGLLIMFICNHCPYVKSIQEKLVRDCSELREYGVESVAIMSNDPKDYPEDSFENMQAAANAYNYPFPYLYDDSQGTAKDYGAICTPDFFGYNANLELQYRGRLDECGMKTDMPEAKRELFEAMKLVAETSNGPKEQIPSMGCSIKWRS